MAEEVKGFVEHYAGFKRHWKPALAVFVVIMGIGSVFTMSLPDIYRSSGFILIEESEIPEELMRSTVTTYATRQVTTLNEKILTIGNLVGIIERYDLFADERRGTPLELLAIRVREDIAVEIQTRDSVSPTGVPQTRAVGFTVSFDSEEPEVAKRVTDELVGLYLEENLRTRSEQTTETAVFLSKQVTKLETEISGLESKLATFKEENADSLPSLNSLNLQMMNRTDQQLSEIERQLHVIDENRITVEAQIATVEPTSPTRLADGSVALSPVDQLKSLQTQLSIIQSKYSEDHPDVIATRRDIGSLQQRFGLNVDIGEYERELADARSELAIAQEKYSAEHPDVVRLQNKIIEVDRQIAQANTDYMAGQVTPDNPAYIALQASANKLDAAESGLRAEQKKLRAKQSDYERRLMRTPQIEKNLGSLSRELSSTTNRYWVMRDKQFAAEVGETLEISAKGEEMVLIEPPRVPLLPYKPDRGAILALAFLFAAIAGLAITQLIDGLDHSIRGANDVRVIQGVSPIVEIPYITTEAEVANSKRRRKMALAASPAVLVIAMLIVHFAVTPLDLLWINMTRSF
jgi:succinoglycan biosynthesis transport protein ExoP